MSENALLVTTETESGERFRTGTAATCWIFGLVCYCSAIFFAFGPDRWFGHPMAASERITSSILFATFGGICPGLGYFVVRGTWRLDDDGILFTPLRGNPRHAAWSDVDAIFAPSIRTEQISLRAGKLKLPIHFRWETRQRQYEVREFLRNKLGESFDVFDRPVPPTSVRRLLWVAASASTGTLVWFGILVLPSCYLEYARWRIWVLIWMPLTLVALYSWVLIFAWEKRQKAWVRRRVPL
jgi:hypothetical protein